MVFEELGVSIAIETDLIEFKSIIKEGRIINQKGEAEQEEIKWLKTIAGFANSQGGVMYVGVDDVDHTLCSFAKKELDHLTLMVHRLIKQRIEPNIHYSIQAIPVPDDERFIFSITVKRSASLPVIVHSMGAALIFVRYFGQTRLATPEEIRFLVLSSDHVSYDNQTTDIKYVREDFGILIESAKKRSKDDNYVLTDKELSSALLFDRDGYLRKGSLLFKDDCLDELTRVVCIKFDGINKGSDRFVSTRTFLGPITKVIDEVLEYVDTLENSGYQKTSTGARNLICFPRRSLLEGIANAFSHRNYFITGSQIEVNIFADRLEIASPGSLLSQKKLDKEKNIATIAPERRNEIIARVLEASFYAQNKGSGFDNIVEDYAHADERHRPFVSSDEDSFVLTLPNLEYFGGVIDEGNPNPVVYVEQEVLTQRELSILSYCYYLNRGAKEIALYVGVKPSTYFRNTILAKLVDKRYLVYYPNAAIPTYRSNPKYVKISK